MRLELSNVSSSAMPYGLGFHPYFHRDATTQVIADTHEVWLSDDETLPTKKAPRPDDLFALTDNCHTGFTGTARIQCAGRADLVITASPDLEFMHIYAPPGEGFFCLEPATHDPDSFNRAISPRDILGPGEKVAIEMSISLSPD